MKLITFVGTSAYQDVNYCWGERTCRTEFLSAAINAWLEPETIYAITTTKAKNSENWRKLQERVPCQAVDIPDGASENELWVIFNQLTSVLAEGDEVVFDLTHSFRSLPMVTLLAAAFLRAARNVRVRHLLYGAFEARDAQGNTPVFDLTPFVSLLDWLTATDQFRRTGNAQLLGDLLKNIQADLFRSAPPETRQQLPKKLSQIGSNLRNLSLGLNLCRPDAVAASAKTLLSNLESAQEELQQYAPPFQALLHKVHQDYADLTSPGLTMQARLVVWHFERGQVTQAVTLGREWIVSWTCQQLGHDIIAGREPVEEALNHAAFARIGEIKGTPSPLLPSLQGMSAFEELISLWGKARDLRNDLAHCGMNNQPKTPEALQRGTEALVGGVKKLAGVI